MTVCTKARQQILSVISSVGDDAHIVPDLGTKCNLDTKDNLNTNSGFNANSNINAKTNITAHTNSNANPNNVTSNIITSNICYRLCSAGEICDKHINLINIKYQYVSVDKYVIMPNHIHMILTVSNVRRDGTIKESKISWASSPTKDIEVVMRTFKTLVTKEIGRSIWQRSYHDHIIRDHADYERISKYIDENVSNWKEDRFYIE